MFINNHYYKKPIGQGGYQNVNKKCRAADKIVFDLNAYTFLKMKINELHI